jgi:glycosyltransferase involved in cell wall biosynthesis
LYANCKLHIFPSFYEGFGFPSLEAGIFSKPTIGANQSSIQEITGKGGVYFNPFDTNEMSSQIYRVLSNSEMYHKLSKLAYKNTELYSWGRNASETIELYEKVINN